ncbi:MAG: hypothetical protein HY840_03765 [Bacteroidetes bacterium]|nr:hypothetical protein [Bacteroidota bacterium]
MKEKDQFSEWYLRQFNQITEEPPKEVWDNVSNELDVNDVWTKIDLKLNSIDRRRLFIRRTAYAATALLLLFIFGTTVFKTYTNPENRIILSDKETNRVAKDITLPLDNKTNAVEKELAKSLDVAPNIKNSVSVSEKYSPVSSAESNPHAIVMQTSSAISENHSISKEGDKERVSAANVIQTNVDTTSISSEGDKKSNAGELFIVPIKTLFIAANAVDSFVPRFTLHSIVNADSNKHTQQSAKNEFYGFYLGGVFSSHNMWLLNQLTFDGLKANSLNETKISFGYSFGISTGYNFSDHWGGELNWYINSRQGQTYNVYNEGQYVARKIKMDFSILNPMLKYRNQGYSNLMKTADSKNILMGITIGMLKRGEDNFNLKSEDITTRFHKANYSLQIGYEYEVIAFRKILLSSAIVANLGVKNIYKGDAYIPASFNRTHIASIELNIGLKYLLR